MSETVLNLAISPSPTTSERICGYNGCRTVLAEDQLFRNCEPCRILKAANAVRFLLDPCSPILNETAYKGEAQTLLTELTGEEILRYMSKLEEQYLNVCKLVKLRGLSASNKKPVQTAAEFVEEVRRNLEPQSLRSRIEKKSTKKTESKISKLAAMLQTDEAGARAWMAGAAEDEGF